MSQEKLIAETTKEANQQNSGASAAEAFTREINSLQDAQRMTDAGSRIAVGASKPAEAQGDFLPKVEIANGKMTEKFDISDAKTKVAFEKAGKLEAPLNRTENLLLGNMVDAVRSGDLARAQNMIQTLAENPGSAARVLEQLKQKLENDPLKNVNYVTGKDSDGNAFVRLTISQRDSFAKSAGHTSVSIDSTGESSAHRQKWGGQPRHSIPAEDALRSISNAQPQHFEKPFGSKPYVKPYLKANGAHDLMDLNSER